MTVMKLDLADMLCMSGQDSHDGLGDRLDTSYSVDASRGVIVLRIAALEDLQIAGAVRCPVCGTRSDRQPVDYSVAGDACRAEAQLPGYWCPTCVDHFPDALVTGVFALASACAFTEVGDPGADRVRKLAVAHTSRALEVRRRQAAM